MTVERDISGEAIRLATDLNTLRDLPGWAEPAEQAWQSRATVLAAYRTHLPPDADTDSVLESPQWPGGHANLGFAHGITGPLAIHGWRSETGCPHQLTLGLGQALQSAFTAEAAWCA